jgi:hypothetical protein
MNIHFRFEEHRRREGIKGISRLRGFSFDVNKGNHKRASRKLSGKA